MGRIHVLSENVANKIAAGEVVERPSSVVKELLENSLDAGARRIRIHVEGGGKKLIQIIDDGCGMVRDDAMLAFERHATSKIKEAEDLLTIATLGFRGEALPSIASVSRLKLETRMSDQAAGTVIELSGGKILRVEEAGLPPGTSITVRDLFFNTPARKKFLKAESTELSQIASLVTHYALAHPDKHFELHSSTNALLVAAPVPSHSERIYQVFGKEILQELIPVAAQAALERAGLPEPPPWRRGEDYHAPDPGDIRLHGFVSKPEIQKLNRNSIFVFVNSRLIRDRTVQHSISEAYRNILPSTVFPVVLLFIEMPSTEVDVNVHPSKTEVRFRQSSLVHDFVRDAVRNALIKARPLPQFTREITAQPTAGSALTPGAFRAANGGGPGQEGGEGGETAAGAARPLPAAGDAVAGSHSFDNFALTAPAPFPINESLQFGEGIFIAGNATIGAAQLPGHLPGRMLNQGQGAVPGPAMMPAAVALDHNDGCAGAIEAGENDAAPATSYAAEPFMLASLKPLGQVRDSFILAVNHDGLWIIDQHVAHERVLFERVLRQRASKPGESAEGQRMLLPLIVELTPRQQAVFSEISDELYRNGFEAEPFGARTIAIKTAPAGLDSGVVERMLLELLDELDRDQQVENLEKARSRIAASIACHAAIKVNMPLEQNKMEWLLGELAKTECPMTCPHGRPVILRYSVKEIQRAFKRI